MLLSDTVHESRLQLAVLGYTPYCHPIHRIPNIRPSHPRLCRKLEPLSCRDRAYLITSGSKETIPGERIGREDYNAVETMVGPDELSPHETHSPSNTWLDPHGDATRTEHLFSDPGENDTSFSDEVAQNGIALPPTSPEVPVEPAITW